MKIPDDVFETRCRYCHHGRAHNGNADVPSSRILSSSYHDKRSCEIFGIAQCDKVPGECLSFKPYMVAEFDGYVGCVRAVVGCKPGSPF